MLLSLFFFGIFESSGTIAAQSLSQTILLAEQLSSQGLYEEAINTYNRVLFFDKSRTHSLETYLALANCHLQLGDLNNAVKQFNLAYYHTSDPNQQLEIQFHQVSLHLLQQNFLQASEELLTMEIEAGSEMEEKFFFYSGITFFGLGQYDSAWAHFHRFIGPEHQAIHDQLNGLYESNEKVSKIRSKKARVMSSILPGLGQFYAGDIKNGVNSLLLTSGLIVLGIHLAIVVSPIDAIVTAMPWYVRYYQGGIQRSGKIAEDKRTRKRTEIYQSIITELGKKESTSKDRN